MIGETGSGKTTQITQYMAEVLGVSESRKSAADCGVSVSHETYKLGPKCLPILFWGFLVIVIVQRSPKPYSNY